MKKAFKNFLVKNGYYSKPDFIIIGAQKAGTTGLFFTLSKHSLIVEGSKKEIHYFDNDDWYAKNELHTYHSFFPLPFSLPKGAKLFEATPIYIFHPEVAKRLHQYNPNLQLILILRNPADRAFSAWTMYHHHFNAKTGLYEDLHDPRTFTEAVEEELAVIEHSTYYEDKKAYVKRGLYHYQVEEFLKYFPKEQILFLESKDLKKSFEQNLAKVQDFIGVPQEDLHIIQANKSKISDKELYTKDIQKLKEFYKPHNEKLFELIGQEYQWD